MTPCGLGQRRAQLRWGYRRPTVKGMGRLRSIAARTGFGTPPIGRAGKSGPHRFRLRRLRRPRRFLRPGRPSRPSRPRAERWPSPPTAVCPARSRQAHRGQLARSPRRCPRGPSPGRRARLGHRRPCRSLTREAGSRPARSPHLAAEKAGGKHQPCITHIIHHERGGSPTSGDRRAGGRRLNRDSLIGRPPVHASTDVAGGVRGRRAPRRGGRSARCSVSTRQIGATPNRPRQSSTNGRSTLAAVSHHPSTPRPVTGPVTGCHAQAPGVGFTTHAGRLGRRSRWLHGSNASHWASPR